MNQASIETARCILGSIAYATLATVTDQGEPWNSPVFAATGPGSQIFWASDPEAQHSRNIAHNGRVFIVIYDSTAEEGTGEGLYLQARANLIDEPSHAAHAMATLAERARYPETFTSATVLRPYCARVTSAWLNGSEVDSEGNYVKDIRIAIGPKALFASVAGDAEGCGTPL